MKEIFLNLLSYTMPAELLKFSRTADSNSDSRRPGLVLQVWCWAGLALWRSESPSGNAGFGGLALWGGRAAL
jgi:hypothetical protein